MAKRPALQEKTAIKVINSTLVGYGARGTVVRIGVIVDNGRMLDSVVDKEEIKKAYADGLEPKMLWEVLVRFPDGEESWFAAEDIAPVQHKFIDIDYIRETDLVIGKRDDGTDIIRPKNTGAFEPGDLISITTKIDGANASVSWDETTRRLEIFSRTNLLNSPGSLRGFYDYIKANVEPKIPWDKLGFGDGVVIFGEWCVSHTVKYNDEWYNKWRVYDIWSRRENSYWGQDAVKSFCKKFGLEYVEELYYGPFISWDHCRSFIGKSRAYGPSQEGVVIKNQTKLGLENRDPVYIKIVDEKFKEHMLNKGHKAKEVDPEKQKEIERATELMSSIVTEARVKKMVLKLIDEGILPSELMPQHMGIAMKNLPKRIFDDVLKEEPAVVAAAGEHAGKLCSTLASKWAKAIIIGK